MDELELLKKTGKKINLMILKIIQNKNFSQ